MNEELKYEEILLELKEAEKLDIDEMEDAPAISYWIEDSYLLLKISKSLAQLKSCAIFVLCKL